MGGQDKLRPYWRHYFTGTQGLIFVVDASDRARIATARAELSSIAADDQLDSAAFLILANKQDLPGALSSEDLQRDLGLEECVAAHRGPARRPHHPNPQPGPPSAQARAGAPVLRAEHGGHFRQRLGRGHGVAVPDHAPDVDAGGEAR